jgi:hypothetical protein
MMCWSMWRMLRLQHSVCWGSAQLMGSLTRAKLLLAPEVAVLRGSVLVLEACARLSMPPME